MQRIPHNGMQRRTSAYETCRNPIVTWIRTLRGLNNIRFCHIVWYRILRDNNGFADLHRCPATSVLGRSGFYVPSILFELGVRVHGIISRF
jgi:hypothetical protein